MRARNSIIFFLLAAAITMPTVAQTPAPTRPRPLPAIQWPGANIGVPEGDYNKSLRSKADMDLPNPYDRDETWLKMPRGRVLGATSAIDIDKDGKSIWIADRCGGTGVCTGKHVAPVMKFDQNGNFVRAFGADMIVYPHGLWVDQQGNVWVADTRSNIEFPLRRDGTPEREVAAPGTVANGNQILKFSPEGKLLMRLGTPGRYGTDESHFTQPSDVVTAPNGDIFVADGHELMTAPPRIMHFDKNGKFIKAWDICSQSIQISDCSHSLAMDSQGRLFVADRGNSLVLVYDQNGKKLADWPQFGRPSGLYIDRNDVLYAADSESSVVQGHAYIRGVHVGSAKTGVVTAFLPDVRGNPVPWFPLRGTTGPEGVVADAAGHIFISQVQPFGQIARYTRKPSP
ncbi:MAG TPA: hypothetical protein VJQ06_12885 [Rhizomicrobium sp.]|nr:hypothetical protein [Rhizomicrobium sp.]